ncbi:MFS transporter [Microvirga pudoricolor]|uniref:MFS transporter n=1 Tax=Microvirga pudoricolor TaxID=2778729 RepID=UPI00194ECB75|nr:MFS transporter [Microvirga pudoricolor]MBM6594887.1 MFS transporter [Microvirga pudoricolor]
MTFRDLLASHGRTVGLGYALALLSSFGQTPFIAVFVSDLRGAFGLSNGTFGLIYSAATLSSGLIMIWLGGLIDRVNAGLYASLALFGLGLAALSLSFASSLALMGVSLFCLRLFGQGMLSHAAITSTARLPEAIRGRAVGIATIGFPSGESVLPGLALLTISTLGWPSAWRMAALVILSSLVAGWAVGRWLGARDRTLDRDLDPPARNTEPRPPVAGPSRLDILRSRGFLLFIPPMIAPTGIFTAYLIHQRYIAETKGWPLEALASGISTYAVVSVVTTMATGTLVDRFGAIRLSHLYLAGLVLASLTLALFDDPAAAPLFFALLGLTGGANNVVLPAVLAELFGTRHLGTVRALSGSICVTASAVTPGVVGLLFDRGVTIGTLSAWFAAYTILATLLTFALPNPRA